MVLAAMSLALITNTTFANYWRLNDLSNAHYQLTKEWKNDFIHDIYVVNK